MMKEGKEVKDDINMISCRRVTHRVLSDAEKAAKIGTKDVEWIKREADP